MPNVVPPLPEASFGDGFWESGKIFKTFQAMRLETPFVLVELGSGNLPSTAGFRNITQGFNQLEQAQAFLGNCRAAPTLPILDIIKIFTFKSAQISQ